MIILCTEVPELQDMQRPHQEDSFRGTGLFLNFVLEAEILGLIMLILVPFGGCENTLKCPESILQRRCHLQFELA